MLLSEENHLFGFIKNVSGSIAIANRIFETRLYNRYLSSKEFQANHIYRSSLWDKNQFTIGGHLNVRLIINGTGNYYIESRTI